MKNTMKNAMNGKVTSNPVWADRSGRFLLETGYYAVVPCANCGGPAEVLTGETYHCGRHHDLHADAPDWVRTEKTW